jgi:hypothetical protein
VSRPSVRKGSVNRKGRRFGEMAGMTARRVVHGAVEADHADLPACCLGHGPAPCDAAPAQRGSLAQQEHGRTIPH